VTDEQTTGIVLRAYPLTESSLVVQWLTPDFGRLSTAAKGARRPKSAFAGKLDLFFLSDLRFRRSRRGDLHTLVEVNVRDFQTGLRRDMPALEQACYFARLIEQVTEPDTPLAGPFALLAAATQALSSRGGQPQSVFAFELKLLEELGLAPDLKEARLSPGSAEIARQLREADWGLISALHLSAAQGREIGRFLREHIIYHLGRIPSGRMTPA
jgi:DNA repair protein RecO